MERKQLRRAMNPAAWAALIYYGIINVSVIVTVLLEMIIGLLMTPSLGGMNALEGIMENAMSSGWGYFLAAAVGIIILLAWKKPRFWREQIWARGRPMKPGAFLGILCVFLSGQFLYQFVVIGLETMFNGMGLTMMDGLEQMSAGSDSFSMFLYMGLLAPVTEELLFRGLVLRTLMPYGKRLAVLGSAFLFGLFHGNFLQTPYAFVVGLVLGYVAAEYSVAWAMLLHMINNLALGDMLTRLCSGMSEMGAAMILWGILLLCAVGAVVTLILRRREIGSWLRANPLGPTYSRCFFGSAGVITFTVVMILNMIVTGFVLVTPL